MPKKKQKDSGDDEDTPLAQLVRGKPRTGKVLDTGDAGQCMDTSNMENWDDDVDEDELLAIPMPTEYEQGPITLPHSSSDSLPQAGTKRASFEPPPPIPGNDVRHRRDADSEVLSSDATFSLKSASSKTGGCPEPTVSSALGSYRNTIFPYVDPYSFPPVETLSFRNDFYQAENGPSSATETFALQNVTVSQTGYGSFSLPIPSTPQENNFSQAENGSSSAEETFIFPSSRNTSFTHSQPPPTTPPRVLRYRSYDPLLSPSTMDTDYMQEEDNLTVQQLKEQVAQLKDKVAAQEATRTLQTGRAAGSGGPVYTPVNLPEETPETPLSKVIQDSSEDVAVPLHLQMTRSTCGMADLLFSPGTITASTLAGRRGGRALEAKRIDIIKDRLRTKFIHKCNNEAHFNALWKRCRKSLSSKCKNAKSKAKISRLLFPE